MSSKLLPCPFCGSRDLFYNRSLNYNPVGSWAYGYIVCCGCGSQGPRMSVRKDCAEYQETLEELVKGAWNFGDADEKSRSERRSKGNFDNGEGA